MGKGQKQEISALKVAGKSGKGGKWGKGKGKGNNGKGYYGGKGQQGYRSPGKAIGKGFKYWEKDDYMAAWGNEPEYDHNWGEWAYGYGDMNYMGNHMMLLEHSTNNTNDMPNTPNNETTTWKTLTGRHDPLTGRAQSSPIPTNNKYMILTSDIDSDDSDSDDTDNERTNTTTRRHNRRTYNPNKRQRQQARRRQQLLDAQTQDLELDSNADDEKIRDAAVQDDVTESDWHALTNQHTNDTTTQHAAPNNGRQRPVKYCNRNMHYTDPHNHTMRNTSCGSRHRTRCTTQCGSSCPGPGHPSP